MTTPNPLLLISPYASLGKADVVRSSMDLSVPDHQLLKSLAPGRGITQTIVQALVHKVCHELKRRNLTDYTSGDVVCHVIATVCGDDHTDIGDAIDDVLHTLVPSSVAGRSSAVAAHGASADGDDGRRTQAMDSDAAKQPYVGTNPPRNAPKRSVGGRVAGHGNAKASSRSSDKGANAGLRNV
jgi:hypothetical protein